MYEGIRTLACEVVKHLRNGLSLEDSGKAFGKAAVDAMPGAQPPEHAGDLFIAVHDFSLSRMAPRDWYQQWGVNWNVTISMRAANVQALNAGPAVIIREEVGLLSWTDKAIGLLDMKFDYVMAAHRQLASSESLAVGTAIIASPVESPRRRTSSWWGATIEDKGGMAGYSQTIRVSGVNYFRLFASADEE